MSCGSGSAMSLIRFGGSPPARRARPERLPGPASGHSAPSALCGYGQRLPTAWRRCEAGVRTETSPVSFTVRWRDLPMPCQSADSHCSAERRVQVQVPDFPALEPAGARGLLRGGPVVRRGWKNGTSCRWIHAVLSVVGELQDGLRGAEGGQVPDLLGALPDRGGVRRPRPCGRCRPAGPSRRRGAAGAGTAISRHRGGGRASSGTRRGILVLEPPLTCPRSRQRRLDVDAGGSGAAPIPGWLRPRTPPLEKGASRGMSRPRPRPCRCRTRQATAAGACG